MRIREAKLVIRGGSAELLFDGEQPPAEAAPRRRHNKGGGKKIAWGGGKASDEAWARYVPVKAHKLRV